MQYTTKRRKPARRNTLCYQDFKDTFVCNTQRDEFISALGSSCVIRISKILLYAIHNLAPQPTPRNLVVLSGFQRYFCMQYTTMVMNISLRVELCYQDFKDTFVCNTQRATIHNAAKPVVLSGFQRYFCMQYTTRVTARLPSSPLCYQDFKDTFVCNTQPRAWQFLSTDCCVIRISMNNLTTKVQKK